MLVFAALIFGAPLRHQVAATVRLRTRRIFGVAES
jgi:hypothetical protein